MARLSICLLLARTVSLSLSRLTLNRFPDSRWIWLGLILAVIAIASKVVVAAAGVPFPPQSEFSDIALSHWPHAEFLRQSLLVHRQLPLWNPTLLGGQPFAADPLAGLWYPPNWLLLLLPLPFGFNLLFLLHLFLAGWGMYAWLRNTRHSPPAAFLGALIVLGMPKLIAHYGAGHFGLVSAVTLTPWALMATRWATSSRGAVRLGAVLALIFLADVRWCAYVLVLVGAYWILNNRFRKGIHSTGAAQFRIVLWTVSIFLLSTAVLWLPLLEFVTKSIRGSLSLEQANVFALGVRDLLGILLPNFGGHHELMTYLGWTVVVFAVLGALSGIRSREKSLRFWILVGGLAGIWALGLQGGIFRLGFAIVPGFSLLRVPSRAWFLVGLAAAPLAAAGLDELRKLSSRKLAFARLASVAVALFGFGVSLGGALLGEELPLQFLWLGIVAALTSIILIFRPRYGHIALLLVVLIDYAVVNASLVETRAAPELLAKSRSVLENLPVTGSKPVGIYSPSFSMQPVALVEAGVSHLEAASPLHLAVTLPLLSHATGVVIDEYTEILPPVSGVPRTANAGALPAAQGLAYFNVRWLVSAFALQAAELELLTEVSDLRVYKNRAYFDPASLEGGAGSIDVLQWSPNRFELLVAAEAPATLRIAQMRYPGWRVYVDEQPRDLAPTQPITFDSGEALPDARLGVAVPTGESRVEFVFQPWTVYGGLVLSLLGWGLVLQSVLLSSNKKHA